MSYKRKLQQHIAEFERENPGAGPVTARDLALWIYEQGYYKPPLKSVIGLLANDISEALRTSYFTDDAGRRVRRKHSVKRRVADETGKQVLMVFWYDIEIAPPQFMAESFGQRRTAIADECWQLQQDVDYFNENLNPGRLIQTWLDFREDIADRQAALQPATA